MQRVYIFDSITGQDITPFVRLVVGAGGVIRVFNSLNIDITENIIFGLE